MKINKLALPFLVIIFFFIVPHLFTLEAKALEDNNPEIKRITTITLEENGRIKVISSISMNFNWSEVLISDWHPPGYNITDVSVVVNGRKYPNFEIIVDSPKPGIMIKSIAVKDNFIAPFTVDYIYYIENYKNNNYTNFNFNLYTSFPNTSFKKTYEYNLKILLNDSNWGASFYRSDISGHYNGFFGKGFYISNFTRKTTYGDTEDVSFLFFKQTSNPISDNIVVNVNKDDTITETHEPVFFSNGSGIFGTELSALDVLKEGTVSLNGEYIYKYDTINAFNNETGNNKAGYIIWNDKFLVRYNIEKGENIHINYELDRGLGFIKKLPDGFSKRLSYQIAYDVKDKQSKVNFEIRVPDDYYIDPNVSLKGFLKSDLSGGDSNRAVWVFDGNKPFGDTIIVDYSKYEKKTADNILFINLTVGSLLIIFSIIKLAIKIKFKTLLEKGVFVSLFKLSPWVCIIYVVSIIVGIYITSSNMFIMLTYSYAYILIPVVITISIIDYFIQRHSIKMENGI